MKHLKFLSLLFVITFSLSAFASAGEKMYKANGKIARVTDTTLMLRTQAQDIEMTRDAKTKVTGTITKGVSASVMYDKVNGQPHATEITVMPGKG